MESSKRVFDGKAPVLALGLVLLAAAGCATYNPDGAPPSEAKNPVDQPARTRIFFGRGETRHVVSLHEDGTYNFKTGNNYGEVIDSREGLWTWKREGTHHAILGLDGDEWSLTFASPDSAMAFNRSAPGQTHVFQFERME